MNQEKEKKENTLWAHITLIRDLYKVKVVQRRDKLLLPLARPMVLRPKECVMIVLSFKLSISRDSEYLE